jgi:hypothetical protein
VTELRTEGCEDATVGVLQWHIQTPQQQRPWLRVFKLYTGVQTEHANTRFWQCLGQCTSRTGDRMVSLRFVGSGGAYMQKSVYTHPTLHIRRDATQDATQYLFAIFVSPRKGSPRRGLMPKGKADEKGRAEGQVLLCARIHVNSSKFSKERCVCDATKWS